MTATAHAAQLIASTSDKEDRGFAQRSSWGAIGDRQPASQIDESGKENG